MTLQYTLPKRRKVSKSGIERAPRRIWPRHRRFVKSHGCCVPGCQATIVDFAHVKTRGAGGHDCLGISLCRTHHSEQHTMSVESFGRKYGIDLWALAREFTRRSPDKAMKDSLKLVEVPR